VVEENSPGTKNGGASKKNKELFLAYPVVSFDSRQNIVQNQIKNLIQKKQ